MRYRKHVLVLVLTVMATLFLGACDKLTEMIDQGSKVKHARQRVELVLEGILMGESKTNNDRYQSISRWFLDVKSLPMGVADPASDDFDAWLRRKGLYPTIKSYEITNAELDADEDDVIVYVTINGTKKLKMRVPNKEAISWEK